jgi:hypothetical protein
VTRAFRVDYALRRAQAALEDRLRIHHTPEEIHMAGRGPAPKDASVRARANKASTKATLYAIEGEVTIPPMPAAEHYVPCPFPESSEFYYEAFWYPAVEQWWIDIWSSPMSSEFSESDMHGLYMGCMFLQETINPRNKATERAAFATKLEQINRNYGLNPMARRSLQWEIDRGDEATDRTDKRRQAKAQSRPATPTFDPRSSAV